MFVEHLLQSCRAKSRELFPQSQQHWEIVLSRVVVERVSLGSRRVLLDLVCDSDRVALVIVVTNYLGKLEYFAFLEVVKLWGRFRYTLIGMSFLRGFEEVRGSVQR